MSERCPRCHKNVMRMPTQYGIQVTIDPEPSVNGSVRIEKAKAQVLGDGQAERAREAGESLYPIHPKACGGAARG